MVTPGYCLREQVKVTMATQMPHLTIGKSLLCGGDTEVLDLVSATTEHSTWSLRVRGSQSVPRTGELQVLTNPSKFTVDTRQQTNDWNNNSSVGNKSEDVLDFPENSDVGCNPLSTAVIDSLINSYIPPVSIKPSWGVSEKIRLSPPLARSVVLHSICPGLGRV